MFVSIYLIVILSLVASTTATGTSRQYYLKVHQGKQANNVYQTHVDISKSWCASKCVPGDPDNCMTATYNRQTKACQLSTDPVANATDVTNLDVMTLSFDDDLMVGSGLSCPEIACTMIGSTKECTCSGHFGVSGGCQDDVISIVGPAYLDNMNIRWKIQAPSNQQISMEFTVHDLEGCCDHVNIFDGPTIADPKLMDTLDYYYNGYQLATETSTGNQMVVRFGSDGSVCNDSGYSGFSLRVCFIK